MHYLHVAKSYKNYPDNLIEMCSLKISPKRKCDILLMKSLRVQE